MKFNPEDPRWTAYALGELDPAERARLAAELAVNPEARRFVEDIQATALNLNRALAGEPSLTLRPEQKVKLHQHLEPAPIVHFPVRWLVSLGAAAGLVAIISIGLFQPKAPKVGARVEADTPVMEIAMGKDDRLELDELQELAEPPDQSVNLLAASAPELPASVDIHTPAKVASEEKTEYADRAMNGPAPSPLVMKGLFAQASGGRPRHESYGAFARPIAAPDADAPAESEVISPSQDDYDVIRENPFQRVADHPLSTFSIDVDSASYAVVRRYLTDGQRPPPDAVRIEELINYFTYHYAPPSDGRPFAVHLDAAPCPWNPAHHLARVAIKAREIQRSARPPVNLVFLVDVSGSMSGENRLPLVKRSLQALARQLDERDRLAIVVYAGAAGTVLPTTSGQQTPVILDALERLQAGGSTAGGAGIQLAYDTARAQFVTGGVNRVILCTDGDFNVGLNQRGDLERLIEDQARSGVYLTVLGFGMGNYKDSTLELLSNKGNGNYGYIDNFSEARRLLVDQMLGTLVAVAKDVKIQVEFNPARVAGYRLIGYENRLLRKEDFNNDKIDAGDVGAGHNVTALYELIPVDQPVPGPGQVDELKYQAVEPAKPAGTDELLTAKLRYKMPDGHVSTRMDVPLPADRLARAPDADFHFASAVAGFGLILRDSPLRGTFSYADVLTLGEANLGEDPGGYRRDFLNLVRNAQALNGTSVPEQ